LIPGDSIPADSTLAGGRGAGGLFCACTETTGRVVGERRLALLSALGELSTIDAASVAEACAAAVRVLESHRADVPYALVYLCEPDAASARLVASYGVRVGGGAAPAAVPDVGGGVSIWRAAITGDIQVATGLATRYPQLVLPVPGAVGDAVPDTAVVIPLRAGAIGSPVGVLVVGVSPYRPLDGEYRAFLELIAGHVESVIDGAALTTRSGGGRGRWPSWTGPRPSSSPISATSSAPR
jgi:GAF domain